MKRVSRGEHVPVVPGDVRKQEDEQVKDCWEKGKWHWPMSLSSRLSLNNQLLLVN